MPETVLARRRTPRMLLSLAGKILDTTAVQELGLSADDILTIYRHMLLTRMFCDAANASAHRGQMALFISSKGQEAAEVASAYALAAHDWIFWHIRSWGAAITRGITIETLFKLLYGVEGQQVAAHILAQRSMLPYILVGNHLPHAVGFAASKAMDGADAVIMAYFGDGATSTADFHGAAHFAAIHHLPIVFFCRDNGVAVSTSLAYQTAVPIYRKARAYGFPGVIVDGRDPFAVYEVTHGLESYREKISVNYVSLADVLSASRFTYTPLDEHGTAGIAVGPALDGRTVFLEAQFSGFVYAMMNHIVAHMARFRQRSAGCPWQSVTVVLPYGGGIPLIEHHREEEVAPFLNSPGLTLCCPATPQEFYDLAWAAAASEKPVLLFIPKLLYRDIRVRSSLRRRMPETAIEHFGARVAHEAQESAQGGVTVIAFGRMIYTALKAAQRAKQHGIHVEVLALRTLTPLPLDEIFQSVEKTKRLVTVEEAPVSGGFGEHLVAKVTSDPTMLATLWATPRCVGAPDIDHPPVPYYASYIPQTADVPKAIEDTFHEEF